MCQTLFVGSHFQQLAVGVLHLFTSSSTYLVHKVVHIPSKIKKKQKHNSSCFRAEDDAEPPKNLLHLTNFEE